MTDIRRVGVLGCGLMGSGIAQVAAMAGYETVVRDVAPDIWSRARANIEQSLAKFVAQSLGQEPVAAEDASGFLVDLLLVPYLLDAVRAVEHRVGSVGDIDRAMQRGCGHPMRPLTLLDFVGLDTTYRIAEIMFDEYREAKYAPPSLLKRMVTAGLMGRKSGKGFYDYSADPPRVVDLGI